MPRVLSGNVELKVSVFIDFSDLVGSSPDGLQFLRQVLLSRSSLVHDKVSYLKGDVLHSPFLCMFELFIACSDEVIAKDVRSKIEHFEVTVNCHKGVQRSPSLLAKSVTALDADTLKPRQRALRAQGWSVQ